ncbi:MAG: hypothetical protein OXI43_00110 [Candidatus Poribacteria bacterium]|nr:hypothetical protein [Candidatus Poribacteria bacterium]
MKIANAPCSWGVLEFDLQGKSPDYTEVLYEMQAIGHCGRTRNLAGVVFS